MAYYPFYFILLIGITFPYEFKYPQSSELATEIEKAYCTDKPDFTVCNEALGKTCMGKICESICARLNLVACDCNTGTMCTVCCLNGTICTPSIKLGLFDEKQRVWYRQSKARGCLKTSSGYGPICEGNEDGKICDFTYKHGTLVEEPWVCKKGFCVHPQCSIRHLSLYVCPCNGIYNQYPHCCRSYNNGTCLPFQWWLKTYAGSDYYIDSRDKYSGNGNGNSNNNGNGGGSNSNNNGNGGGNGNSNNRGNSNNNGNNNIGIRLPTHPPNFKIKPCINQADGIRCGPKKLCQKEKCVHACGNYGINECVCDTGSIYECHVCCYVNGQCRSANQNTYAAPIIRPIGSLCNYGFGTCDSAGYCKVAGDNHPSFHFCHDKDNDGIACGTANKCKNKKCEHVCGSEELSCICSPGSKEECHICCLADGQCQTVNENTYAPPIVRPIGTRCNYTFGTCDALGACKMVGHSHPSSSFCQKPGNDKKLCGSYRICTKNECKHICGDETAGCRCSPGMKTECHKCCIKDGACKSVNENPLTVEWIEPIGISCNFSFGTCDSKGECGEIGLRHPNTELCADDKNEGKMCGQQKICSKKQCIHLCSEERLSCLCSPESKTECDFCCFDKENGKCQSVNKDPNRPKIYRTIGSICNYTFGRCSAVGECKQLEMKHPLATPCQDESNDGKACGFARRCSNEKCSHVCGSEDRLCLCNAGSNLECHVCCLKDGICRSVFDSKNRDLLRTPGTSCNYTFGVCSSNGFCKAQKNHPSKQLCDYEENDGNQCASRHVCQDFGCTHVCTNSEMECRCQPGSAQECHVCCKTTNGQCASIFNGQKAYLKQNVGTQCNFSQGTCNDDGRCEKLATFCNRPENDKVQCGTKQRCMGGACQHVCGGEDDECICEAGGPEECHVCCLQKSSFGNNTCVSMHDNKKGYLIRPYGSSCNFTRGICIEEGVCDNVLNHPFYDGAVSMNLKKILLILVIIVWSEMRHQGN